MWNGFPVVFSLIILRKTPLLFTRLHDIGKGTAKGTKTLNGTSHACIHLVREPRNDKDGQSLYLVGETVLGTRVSQSLIGAFLRGVTVPV